MATTPVLAPALRAELGDAAPACLRGLEAPEQERLAQLLADARIRQHAALERAVEEGLSFLPRVVRAAVARLLF